MRRTLFILITIFLGFLIDAIFYRYFSVAGVAPQMLLLFVMAFGFIFGPLLGESLGFVWGLMADSIGVHLFGLQSLLLVFAGYVAGAFRRRVASERYQAQVAIALIATLLYGLGSNWAQSVFEEGNTRVSFWLLLFQMVMNGALVTIVFYVVDRWVEFWGVHPENL